MKNHLLSIVIPVFGTEKYLKRCLESVINQSYRNLEIILVNDCSQDHSDVIISEYEKKDSRIISVCHEVNRGLFAARLTGAKIAKGDYIAFVDSDDYLALDYYQHLMERADEGFDIVAAQTVRGLEDERFFQYPLHAIVFGEKPLYDSDVRNAFYANEGSCYAWHTIWNKVYSKRLWDKCLPVYETVTDHLLMTEDVLFSSVLFYNATSFVYQPKSSYFYCENKQAATNSNGITVKRLEKNLRDMTLVFDTIDRFLVDQNADFTIRNHILHFRQRYYRMWKALIDQQKLSGKEKKEVEEGLERLGKNYCDSVNEIDYYFDSPVSDWHSELETIKKAIASSEVDVVSFDIFDTLLLRPLWYPNDIYVLLQDRFEEICPNIYRVSFGEIRLAAEDRARRKIYERIPGSEDITLTEIYQELAEYERIPLADAFKLMELEKELELHLAQPRQTGKALFDFALAMGKKVILTSDMYLEKNTIEAMLTKCGYEGYEKIYLSSDIRLIKHTGRLFDYVSSNLGISKNHILHIGDNFDSDITMASKKGLKTGFLPKTKDRACNGVPDMPSGRFSIIGCQVGSVLTTWNKQFNSIGYRSMMAMSANKAFDNPYASWNPSSDFNCDPYLMGYSAVGMHLVGMTSWLADCIHRRNIKSIVYLARDGYLPSIAFEHLKTYFGIEDVTMKYVPISRMALFPWMIENKGGLYSLPIEYRNHNPRSMVKLLRSTFLISEETVLFEAEKNGFELDRVFTEKGEYHTFLRWFEQSVFSDDCIEKAKERTRKFYRDQIEEGSLVFDMGYSGRIPSALQKCLGYPVVFAYIHHDNAGFHRYRKHDHLDFEVMYDFVPPFSDLVREYLLSEPGHSCVGLIERNDEIVPLFEMENLSCLEKFAVDRIRSGAVDFMDDFVSAFSSVRAALEFDPVQVSMPFEGLIHLSTESDRRAFAASFSDDFIYGRNEKINLHHFWMRLVPDFCKETGEINYEEMVRIVAGQHGRFIKLLVYATCDRKLFKEYLSEKLVRHPFLLKVGRKTYHGLRKIKRMIRREQ